MISDEESQISEKHDSNFENNQAQNGKISKNKKNVNIGRWEKYEHIKFLEACNRHGNDWIKVFSNHKIVRRTDKDEK